MKTILGLGTNRTGVAVQVLLLGFSLLHAPVLTAQNCEARVTPIAWEPQGIGILGSSGKDGEK